LGIFIAAPQHQQLKGFGAVLFYGLRIDFLSITTLSTGIPLPG
jgi:hypothetical protein